MNPTVLNPVKTCYKNGGNLLLTNHAPKYLKELGRIDQYPDVVNEVSGGNIDGLWRMLPTYGTLESNSSMIPIDRSGDPIYAGMLSHKLRLGSKLKWWTLFPMISSR